MRLRGRASGRRVVHGLCLEEPKLIKYAYAVDQALQVRHEPKFLEGYATREFSSR